MSNDYPPPEYLPYRYPYYPYPAPQPKRDWTATILWVLLFAGFAGLLIAPLLFAIGAYAYYQVFEVIVPGVHVGETRLGGLSVFEAASRVHKTWNMDHRLLVGVMVEDEVMTWTLAPADLGLSIDPVQTARNAYSIGHSENPVVNIRQILGSARQGWEILPVVVFDYDAAKAGLESLARLVDVPARDASFTIDNGKVTPLPARSGYAIDIEEALTHLSQDAQEVIVQGHLALQVVEASPRVTDVSGLIAEVERLLDTPVELKAYDPVTDEHFNWPVPQDLLVNWLVVVPGESGPQVSLNTELIAEHLAELGEGLGEDRWIDSGKYATQLAGSILRRSPLTLTVNYEPRQYLIQPGDSLIAIAWRSGIPAWKILEYNPGLDPDVLIAGQELTIPPKDAMLPLPVVENKRIAISISQQRLWTYQDGELLAEHVISTGQDRSPTQPGIFQVQSHVERAYASVWDLYMPNFIGIYEAWPGFMNGIHGLPTLSSGRQLWAGVLGRPVSYGCIVIDIKPSEELFTWAEKGVVVEILP